MSRILKLLGDNADINQGTNDEKIKKQVQISWDNVPLNPNNVGHLEILCVKWCKNAVLAEH